MRSCSIALIGLLCCLGAGPAGAQPALDLERSAVLDRVNHYRALAGLQAVTIDTRLQAAAQSHARYMAETGELSHTESDRGSRSFTGASLKERLRAASAGNAQASEVVGMASVTHAHEVVDNLMTAIYHRYVMLSADAEHAGVGVARGRDAGPDAIYVAVNFSGSPAPQAAPALTVYPAPGQARVQSGFDPSSEAPNPLPGSDLAGQPISIQTGAGATLSVTDFRLYAETADGPSSAIQTRRLTQAADLNTPVWAAALIPVEALAPSTTYRAEFAGAVNGAPVSMSWRFSTAARQPVAMSFLQPTVPPGKTQTVTLRNLDQATGGYYVCYRPAQLVTSAEQFSNTKFGITVTACADAGSCTVTVTAARDRDCDEPIAQGSFEVSG